MNELHPRAYGGTGMKTTDKIKLLKDANESNIMYIDQLKEHHRGTITDDRIKLIESQIKERNEIIKQLRKK